jgi:hypothetical protein
MNKEILTKNLMLLLECSGNSWILMSPNSIGEAYITCGFAKGFLDTHGGPVTLCLKPEHADIPKWFYPILLFGSLITKIVSNSSLPTDIPISIVGNENKGMMASSLTKKILEYDGVKFEKFI